MCPVDYVADAKGVKEAIRVLGILRRLVSLFNGSNAARGLLKDQVNESRAVT